MKTIQHGGEERLILHLPREPRKNDAGMLKKKWSDHVNGARKVCTKSKSVKVFCRFKVKGMCNLNSTNFQETNVFTRTGPSMIHHTKYRSSCKCILNCFYLYLLQPEIWTVATSLLLQPRVRRPTGQVFRPPTIYTPPKNVNTGLINIRKIMHRSPQSAH